MKRLLLAVLVLVVLLLPFASAIGVSPGRITINFEPGAIGAASAVVHNTNDYAVDVSVGVEGRYHESFEVEEFSLGPRERKSIAIHYVLPDDITPGTNRQKIVFIENFFDPNAGFGARTGVVLQFDLWKPYPGQYVDMVITPRHVAQGSDTDVLVKLYSRGEEAVSGDVEMRIYTPDDKLQDLVIMDNVQIAGNTNFERYAIINSKNWDPGKYRIEAAYDFGSGVARQEGKLIIGTKSLDIIDVTRTYYKDAEINRFEIEVESLWNEPLEQVFASFELGASSGQTPSIIVAPFTRNKLFGYWVTDANLAQGNHTAQITVDFEGGEPVIEQFTVEVLNVTPIREEQPAQTEEKKIELGYVDLAFLIVIIVFVVYLMQHSVHTHRKKPPKRPDETF